MVQDSNGMWKHRRLRAHVLLAIAVASTVVIGVYPQLGALLPACPIHEHFGILCPGCGGTRALIALLHGRIGEAIRMNGMVVALAPFALLFAAASYRRALEPGTFHWPELPGAIVYGLVVAGVAFAVVRNLA
jgi:hypothetical protein